MIRNHLLSGLKNKKRPRINPNNSANENLAIINEEDNELNQQQQDQENDDQAQEQQEESDSSDPGEVEFEVGTNNKGGLCLWRKGLFLMKILILKIIF